MKKIFCFCEHGFDIDFPDVVNLDEEEATMDLILSGDFMSVKCPQCSTVLKPELPFRIDYRSKQQSLYFIPELDRSAYMLGKLEYETGNPERIIIGYKELVEKLTIIKAGLDDQVIEAIKYYILSKAQESSRKEDIHIYFNQQKGDILLFYIEGLKKDEIGQYTINVSFYNKIRQDLSDKLADPTFAAFLMPPYVSLNKVYLE